MKTTFILVFSLFFFYSCHKDTANEVKTIDNFDTFYEKFHTDSAYQMDHIQFPLAGSSSAKFSQERDFKWYKEDWNIHQAFPENTGFRSTFTKVSDDFIIETILLNEGAYGMERRFSKFGSDGWFLIYYSDLSLISIEG